MIDFLIKSTASLFVLLAVYHLVLENEKMHQFNRFYLLFAISFSLTIPFVTIEVIQEISTAVTTQTIITPEEGNTRIVEDSTNYWLLAVYTLYGLITSVLLIRFIRNILKLRFKTKSTTTIDYKKAQLVLVAEETLPYTFLNTIFINEMDYYNRKIEDELYTHELIHVTQKHTLDILFIEILKVIFWFNPIFIFYKKAIQLNHEFLADEKVVQSYNNVPFYQNLLISKAKANPTYYLASNLNYSVTKKRLIMMTKTTSKTILLLKKITLIPVFTALTFFICVQAVAQKNTTLTKGVIAKTPNNLTDRDAYYAGVRVIIKDSKKNVVTDKMYEELSIEKKNRYLDYVPKAYEKKSPTKKEYETFKNSSKFAIWIDSKSYPNSKLNDYKASDFVYFSGSSVYKNARTKRFPQPFQFSLYTLDYFNKNLKNAHKKFSGPRITIYISKEDSRNRKEIISNKQNDMIHSAAAITEMPSYPGGITEFYKFVGQNFKISKEMSDAKAKGKVYITFVVEKDGSISDIKKIRDFGYGTGEEAIRVMKLSPKWIPGKLNNEPVRVMYSLPITVHAGQ